MTCPGEPAVSGVTASFALGSLAGFECLHMAARSPMKKEAFARTARDLAVPQTQGVPFAVSGLGLDKDASVRKPPGKLRPLEPAQSVPSSDPPLAAFDTLSYNLLLQIVKIFPVFWRYMLCSYYTSGWRYSMEEGRLLTVTEVASQLGGERRNRATLASRRQDRGRYDGGDEVGLPHQ